MERDDEAHLRGVVERLARGHLSDFPPLPAGHERLTDPSVLPMPEECKAIAACARGPAIRLLGVPGVRAVGLGLRARGGVETSEFALVALVDRKLPPGEVPSGCMLPRSIAYEGKEVPVDVQEAPFAPSPRPMIALTPTSSRLKSPRRKDSALMLKALPPVMTSLPELIRSR
jgi:hypothetical protein